jgi:hypothetical protein
LRAASITRSRVSSAMLDPGVKARETADCDTPASAATSKEVARDRFILLGIPASNKAANTAHSTSARDSLSHGKCRKAA